MRYIFVIKEPYQSSDPSHLFEIGDGLIMSNSQPYTAQVTCLLGKTQILIPHSYGNIYKENEIFKCSKCSKYITEGYIKIAPKKKSGPSASSLPEQIYHKKCFTCEKCNRSLIGLRFSIVNEKKICSFCKSDVANLDNIFDNMKLKEASSATQKDLQPKKQSKNEKTKEKETQDKPVELEEPPQIETDPTVEETETEIINTSETKEEVNEQINPPSLNSEENDNISIESGLDKASEDQPPSTSSASSTIETLSLPSEPSKAETNEQEDTTCAACQKKIEEKGAIKYIRAMGKNWHTNCFVCFQCKKPFTDSMFCNYEGKPCCSEDYKKLMEEKLPKCKKCKKAIVGRCVATDEDKYHVECFICCVDEMPISLDEGGFYKKEGKFYCPKHYKETFSEICKECGKALEDACVNIEGNKYHKTCLKCKKCKGDIMKLGLSTLSKKKGKLICVKCAQKS